jgi:hypothetical protein
MNVEIGALLQKDFGQKVLDSMNGFEGVKSVTIESGRSSDLFEEKQFGDFGEAAILSIIADNAAKDKVFDAVYNLCELHGTQSGMLFMTPGFLSTK